MAMDNTTLLWQLNDDMRHAVLWVTIWVGVEVVLAFFGNLLVIYVFWCRYHNCNFRYFVLCLAFTDIISSLTTMPGEMVTQLYWYTYPVPTICKIKSFFNVFTVASEALCLLTIGIDRYLKICRPLRKQMQPEHAKYLCLVIYVLAGVLAVPVAIFWGTHNKQKIYQNVTITVTVCEKDGRWLHTNHPLQYTVGLEIIISISLVIMFSLYVLIARKILHKKVFRFRANTFRRKYASSSSNNSSSAIKGSESLPETRDCDNTLKKRDKMAGKWINNAKTESLDPDITQVGQEESRCNVAKHDKDSGGNKPNGMNLNISLGSDEDRTNRSLDVTSCNNKAEMIQSNDRDSNSGQTLAQRVRRKTLIMCILTVVFIVTTIVYLTMLSCIANSILDTLSNSRKAWYFFGFRFYFINHVINPIVYGFLDPQFKEAMSKLKRSVSTTWSSWTSVS